MQLLLFADDLMLVSEEEDVERNLSILEDVMANWKMKIKGEDQDNDCEKKEVHTMFQ